MTCSEFEQGIGTWASGMSGQYLPVRMIGHTKTCAECRELLEDARQIMNVMNSTSPPEPPAGYLEKLPEAVSRRIAAEESRSQSFGGWRVLAAAAAVAAIASLGIWIGPGTQVTPAPVDEIVEVDIVEPLEFGEPSDILARAPGYANDLLGEPTLGLPTIDELLNPLTPMASAYLVGFLGEDVQDYIPARELPAET